MIYAPDGVKPAVSISDEAACTASTRRYFYDPPNDTFPIASRMAPTRFLIAPHPIRGSWHHLEYLPICPEELLKDICIEWRNRSPHGNASSITHGCSVVPVLKAHG